MLVCMHNTFWCAGATHKGMNMDQFKVTEQLPAGFLKSEA